MITGTRLFFSCSLIAGSLARPWSKMGATFLNGIVRRYLEQRLRLLASSDIAQLIGRLPVPRIAELGHYNDLQVRRHPSLVHDLDGKVVARLPRPNRKGR